MWPDRLSNPGPLALESDAHRKKLITCQTDLNVFNSSSKTYVFEDKWTKY